MSAMKMGDYVEGRVIDTGATARGLYCGASHHEHKGAAMLWVADERSDHENEFCAMESIRRLPEDDLDEKTAWHLRTGRRALLELD